MAFVALAVSVLGSCLPMSSMLTMDSRVSSSDRQVRHMQPCCKFERAILWKGDTKDTLMSLMSHTLPPVAACLSQWLCKPLLCSPMQNSFL